MKHGLQRAKILELWPEWQPQPTGLKHEATHYFAAEKDLTMLTMIWKSSGSPDAAEYMPPKIASDGGLLWIDGCEQLVETPLPACSKPTACSLARICITFETRAYARFERFTWHTWARFLNHIHLETYLAACHTIHSDADYNGYCDAASLCCVCCH